jgi:hypothetical protein
MSDFQFHLLIVIISPEGLHLRVSCGRIMDSWFDWTSALINTIHQSPLDGTLAHIILRARGLWWTGQQRITWSV